MSAQHKPGPWVVQMLTKPQPRRFHVARQVEDGTWSSPHWEQLRDADGGVAAFETHADAEDAIARATGESA